MPDGQNCRLGRNVIVGQRVWDVEGKFRVRVGPLGFADFRRFMPDGDALLRPEPNDPRLRRSAVRFRRAAGAQGRRSAVVPTGRRSGPPARLGWNTWIRCNEFANDVDDAVFSINV